MNKISCIRGSFLLSPTLPELWNSHGRPDKWVCYVFSFFLFRWFHKLWGFICLHYRLVVINAIRLAFHNPRALISSLTSLPAAVECWRNSPVNCFTRISLQTSFNRINIMFLKWLWRIETMPPFCKKVHAGYQTYCRIHNWMVVLWVSNQIWYGSDPRIVLSD